MEQKLLYKVTNGEITNDEYWEMMNHRIKAITRELYNAELNNAYVREISLKWTTQSGIKPKMDNTVGKMDNTVGKLRG